VGFAPAVEFRRELDRRGAGDEGRVEGDVADAEPVPADDEGALGVAGTEPCVEGTAELLDGSYVLGPLARASSAWASRSIVCR
jgi:hypothetical protein